jgi:hypothetical protein
MKVHHRIKNIKSVFLSNNYDLHSFKVLHNNWCSLHYMYIMKKETIERIRVPKEKKMSYSFQCSLYIYIYIYIYIAIAKKLV